MNPKKSPILISFCLSLVLFSRAFLTVQGNPRDTLKTYSHGVVVSASVLSSEVGVHILEKGGTPVDAAIGVQFALAVVFPQAGNIGGGGFMVIRTQSKNRKGIPGSPQYFSLDYRETAPGTATRNMYLNTQGEVIKGESVEDLRASGIPGVVDGMIRAHKRFGKLSWKSLVEPSIVLAREGFILTEQEAAALNGEKSLFIKLNGDHCPFVKSEADWKAGDRLIQPDLAKTLSLIAEKGRSGFYGGEVASRLVNQMNTPIKDSTKGLIHLKDLQTYRSVWREPIIQFYKGYKVITMPPPSSGGISLFQLLSLVQNFPVSQYGYGSAAYIHLVVEAQKRAFADRSFYLGDPDFVQVPVSSLLSKDYLKTRFENYDSLKIIPSSEIKPGYIENYVDMGPHIRKESEETTHFSVADANGNAVSVTTTLNYGFGSGVVAQGSGFILNNEMDDFSVKPGVPNLYGLIGGEANAIQPHKRMLSSMTPTILDSGNHLFMVVGSPGGSTIPNTVFQTIMNVLEFHMNMQEAVAAPRFHSQWIPDKIYIEKGGFQNSVIKKLESEGYGFITRGGIGRCDAIRINSRGKLEPGADPRGDDEAYGY
jgi:gamma-glutamyltranspeptidase/glutathione hydrolase